MSQSKESSMNVELKEWIEETRAKNKEKATKKKSSGKKPKGTCNVCGKKVAKSVCLKCGKSVCGSCYFKIIGVCKKCIPKDIAEKWEGKQPDWERLLGVEWVE
jgi:hypothetical protein